MQLFQTTGAAASCVTAQHCSWPLLIHFQRKSKDHARIFGTFTPANSVCSSLSWMSEKSVEMRHEETQAACTSHYFNVKLCRFQFLLKS